MDKNFYFLNQAWQTFLQTKTISISRFFLENNLKKCFVVADDDKNITFQVPNQTSINYICEQGLGRKFLRRYKLSKKEIHFIIKDQKNTKSTPPTTEPKTKSSKIILNTNEKVVIGDFNNKIFQIVEQMLGGDKKWNPLFIYSGSGLGKTCLLNVILENLGSGSVFYTSGLNFVSLVFEKLNLPSVEIENWKRSFEQYDVFLFDDVHFLANKTKTKEIFFQILNRAIEQKKIVIFTSEVHPENFLGFEKRLQSRFQTGLVLEIQFPNTADSIKITQQKLRLYCPKVKVTKEAVAAIARGFSRDIRRLEGIVKLLAFQREFENPEEEVDLKMLKKIFGEKKWISRNRISITQIQVIVANYFGLSRKDLISGSKKAKVTMARHLALFLAKKNTSANYKCLANAFGLKSHSTILFAVKKIITQITTNSQLKNDLKQLTKLCHKINKN